MTGRDQQSRARDTHACDVLSIAQLNDSFRRGQAAGTVAITNGILSLGSRALVPIMERVLAYDSFDNDSDPYGEHDFGAFDHDGGRIFWKIDYYSRDLTSGSLNPADPSVTARVLTIMLAGEY